MMTSVRNFLSRLNSSRVLRRSPIRRKLRSQSTNAVDALEPRLLLTFDLVLDYTYDSTNFFSDQSRRDVLETAATMLESRITDDLSAITPGSGNSWTSVLNNPTTNARVDIGNLTVPADTIIIYVGARDLSGSLGLGGPAGYRGSGSQSFLDNLDSRGEPGVDTSGSNDTDFAPIIGTLSIDSNAGTNWNFTLDPPSQGEEDLLSVALHEMSHILGFGTSESFTNTQNGSGQITSSAVMSEYGGPVPLHTDLAHFASGTDSALPGTATIQETLLDPQITTGTRELMTALDWAVLDDIGWDVTPVAAATDYGDAPDATAGTGTGNYQTRNLDDGPSHVIGTGLYIGSTAPDSDDGSQQNSGTADDTNGTDDEGFDNSDYLSVISGVASSINVNVTNTSGSDATLWGWVDYDNDGQFETGERTGVAVPAGTNNGTVALDFPAIGNATTATFLSYARFRLIPNGTDGQPTGPVSGGEVEDHTIRVYSQAQAHDSLPSFTWDTISGSARYELEVDNVSTGESQVILQSYIPETTGTTSFRPLEALPAGVYRWRYRVHTGASFLPWSSYVDFTIFETGDRPFITDPVDASIDSLPTFAWSPVTGATRYELWVNETNHTRIIHQNVLTQTSFTPLTGLPEGNYTAWVRAYDGSGAINGWSDGFTFAVAAGTVNEYAHVTDPVSATTTNSAPTIAWLPNGGTDHDLTITDVDTSQVVLQASGITGTSYTVEQGLPPGTYSAAVRINGQNGTVSTATVTTPTFRIEAVSGQAELITPYGNSEDTLPVFSWTPVTGADRYELWVNDVTNSVNLVIHDSSLTGTSFKTQTPLNVGVHRAWVRAFTGTTPIGAWSSAVDFQVTEASDIPTIWGPLNTTLNTVPTFSWSSVADRSHYTLSLSDGSTVVASFNQLYSNSITLDDTLPPGTYTVTVTAEKNGGSTAQDTQTFTVGTTANTVSILTPFDQTNDTRPTISWPNIDSATRYSLWVNDLTRNVTGTILEGNVEDTAFTPDDAMLPGDYRVWVRPYNGTTAVGAWSAGVQFTIQESSGVPVVTSPLPQTTNTVPTFTWSAVTGAATYDIEVTATSISATPITRSGLTATSHRLNQAVSSGDYQVRVRSVDGSNVTSAWSTAYAFSIDTATNATLVTPLFKSSTAATDVFFAWPQVTDATRYELWVSSLGATATRIIHETQLTDLSFTPASTLAAGDYRAWVRAIGQGDVAGAWSSGIDFTIT